MSGFGTSTQTTTTTTTMTTTTTSSSSAQQQSSRARKVRITLAISRNPCSNCRGKWASCESIKARSNRRNTSPRQDPRASGLLRSRTMDSRISSFSSRKCRTIPYRWRTSSGRPSQGKRRRRRDKVRRRPSRSRWHTVRRRSNLRNSRGRSLIVRNCSRFLGSQRKRRMLSKWCSKYRSRNRRPRRALRAFLGPLLKDNSA